MNNDDLHIELFVKEFYYSKKIKNKSIFNFDNIMCLYEPSETNIKLLMNSYKLAIYTNNLNKYNKLEQSCNLDNIIYIESDLNINSAIQHSKISFRECNSTIINFNTNISKNININTNDILDEYFIVPNNFEYNGIFIIYDIFISSFDNYIYIICPNIKHYLQNTYSVSINNLQIFINGQLVQYDKIYDKNTKLLVIKQIFKNPIVTIKFYDISKDYALIQYKNQKNKMIMSTIFKDENHLVDSWIRYHKKLGFNLFILYNNNPDNKQYYYELLNRYPNEIIFINWGYPYELFESGISGQTTQQTHTITKYKLAKYIALLDLDEYIVSLKKPFLSFLNDFEKEYDKISVIAIETNWFGCAKNISYSKDDKNSDFVDKLLFRCKTTTGPFQHQKAIVNPKNIILFTVHESFNYTGMYIFINPKLVRMNHYYIISNKKRQCDCNINDNIYDDYIVTSVI